MTLKLKLHREAPAFEPQAGSHMRFPVQAVQAMQPASKGRAMNEQDAMRHPELIRQIEATLDRMQAGLDQLQEHVSNYKFPGAQEEDRPRAA